jgi:hypothetical protein
MKHFLRKDQVFTFNWDVCKKHLVSVNQSNSEVLTTNDSERIVTQFRKETKPGGWERTIEEKLDYTVYNRSTLNAKFIVIDITTGHGMRDTYLNGHYVTSRQIGTCVTLSFYQSGCFTGMIYPVDLNLISGPEDKDVVLKQIWVETE